MSSRRFDSSFSRNQHPPSQWSSSSSSARNQTRLFVRLVVLAVVLVLVVQIYIFARVSHLSVPLTQQTAQPAQSALNPTSTRGVLKHLQKEENKLKMKDLERFSTLHSNDNFLKDEVDPALAAEILKAVNECMASGGSKLSLVNLGLISLSPAIMDQILQFADTLELLNLGGNSLSVLPSNFSKLRKLRILFFADNSFESIPQIIGQLPSLFMLSFKSNRLHTIAPDSIPNTVEWLILTDNNLSQLPHTMGNLTKLRKLMLAGNQLSSLPESMRKCTALELIRLSSNKLIELPNWLLKDLPNLTWVAAGGNPVLPAPSTRSDSAVPRIPPNELMVEKLIGEGASGFVYKAQWNHRDVAIKVFKGNMTSDGLPADELKSTLLLAEYVTEHATQTDQYPITPILGLLEKGGILGGGVSMPAGGLVMELVPPSFQLLGGPPTFATITRDTFDSSPFKLEPSVACAIARQVTHAVMEIHAANLTHGDLYAHNLLVRESNNEISVRLCDMGAATYVGHSSELAQSLQAFELRALGKLLDDIIVYLVKDIDQHHLQKLEQAKQHLLQSAIFIQQDKPGTTTQAMIQVLEILKD